MRERHQQQQLRQSEQEESDDKHSVFTRVRKMMLQMEQDKARITEIANEVTIERTVMSDMADKMEQQAQAVTIDREAIEALKKQVSATQTLIATEVSKIRTEVSNFGILKTESETRLKDQAQAITVESGKVDSMLKSIQKMTKDSTAIVTHMRKENEEGNNIIRAIQSLATSESHLMLMKNRIKAYGNIIQHRFDVKAATSPTPTTTSVTLSNDIKVIQRKLDKMKLFAQNSKKIVK